MNIKRFLIKDKGTYFLIIAFLLNVLSAKNTYLEQEFVIFGFNLFACGTIAGYFLCLYAFQPLRSNYDKQEKMLDHMFLQNYKLMKTLHYLTDGKAVNAETLQEAERLLNRLNELNRDSENGA